MSGNPAGSRPDAPNGAEAVNNPEDGAPAKPAGADQWAKAVVDGVPGEAEEPVPAAEATEAADVAPDSAEDPDSDLDESWLVDEATGADATERDQGSEGEARDMTNATDPAVAPETVDSASPETAHNPGHEMTVEDLVVDLERVTIERDQYLDASRRLQAEFENYKKQVSKRELEARERANDSLVGELLPVLDAFDGAVANGAEDVAPMRTSFLDALAKQGLERIDPAEGPFDPTLHEAVMHEESSDTDGPVVAEVMRAGYLWKGRVLRPAMVRTRG